MDRSRLAVIIPALNESKSIGPIVLQAGRYGLPIVIDDGSADRTGDIARDAGADVVRHETNLGYDKALESGFARAEVLECEYAITLDADGQHNPNLVSEFIRELENGAEVVIGVRDQRQRVSERVFAWMSTWLWGVHDPLCGMKGYRMTLYRRLGHFDSYGSIGTELALFGARTGSRVREVPVPTKSRLGTSRFGQIIGANFRIFRALAFSLRPLRARAP